VKLVEHILDQFIIQLARFATSSGSRLCTQLRLAMFNVVRPHLPYIYSMSLMSLGMYEGPAVLKFKLGQTIFRA